MINKYSKKEGMDGEERQEGFWHYQHYQGEYHFHESYEGEVQMIADSSSL